eukprot:217930-Amphidinium_carterae.1
MQQVEEALKEQLALREKASIEHRATLESALAGSTLAWTVVHCLLPLVRLALRHWTSWRRQGRQQRRHAPCNLVSVWYTDSESPTTPSSKLIAVG